MLRVGFEVSGNILNQVWILASSLQHHIQRIYEREFNNSFVIGLQLRFGDKSFGTYPANLYLNEMSDTLRFIECAQKIEPFQMVHNE